MSAECFPLYPAVESLSVVDLEEAMMVALLGISCSYLERGSIQAAADFVWCAFGGVRMCVGGDLSVRVGRWKEIILDNFCLIQGDCPSNFEMKCFCLDSEIKTW